MRAIRLSIDGRWGHFRKAETNNNPLSHDFITKTALIGLIGAVNGIEREAMKILFPKLCNSLLYGVEIKAEVKKQSWGFTFRQASDVLQQAPRYMEILSHPSYSVTIACLDSADGECQEIFDFFSHSIENKISKFTPVLGIHNCPADILFESKGIITEEGTGNFSTLGFISKKHTLNIRSGVNLRLGFDRIPTYQNDDFWNLPEHYETIIYPNIGGRLDAIGTFFLYQTASISDELYLI